MSPDPDRKRLFVGSCVALVATSVAFATVGAVMLALKDHFVLTNAQVGWIGGAALWGFAVSQLLFSPFCDTLGMRTLLRLAFVAHVAGTIAMILATGFWMLAGGALVIAMGNGLVEAACNPLVATLYPESKTVKLNQFHVWFPGGIVLGGLSTYVLDYIDLGVWQIKLSLILVPTVAYGALLLFRKFPATENVQAGVSVGEMFRATFLTPLMWLMLFCMMLTASIELGPNRWVPAVLEAGGIAGILVLVWINGLMALLRSRAGPVVERLSPTGILLCSAGVSGLGLLWLSYAETGLVAFAAASVFAVGVCYFWPTMLGFVSERVPTSGALGLGLMGAVGMAAVGLVTSPAMGEVADRYAHSRLEPGEVLPILESARRELPAQVERGEAAPEDIVAATAATDRVLSAYRDTGALPPIETANALRAVVSTGAPSSVVDRAEGVLGPADNYGGRVSFRYVVPLSGVLVLVFGVLWIRDRRGPSGETGELRTAVAGEG